ncbi:tuberoinfundibular peptide of 39 residues [Osmerus mordax]|uniref:tuberoinfundibular peptide of 39 residues n=1 Tax=Osmerus mordax TaxID=8014 RepID=UPI00351069C6
MTDTKRAGTLASHYISSRMAGLPFLILSLLGQTLVTSGFPQTRLQHLHRGDLKPDQWEILYPSISLRDWSIQMMSTPDFGAAKSKAELLGEAWLPASQSQLGEALVEGWPGDWPSNQGPNEEKRNIVVADDAAFREKSKLLTAMERQKWLNSYMQKLLVVNQ